MYVPTNELIERDSSLDHKPNAQLNLSFAPALEAIWPSFLSSTWNFSQQKSYGQYLPPKADRLATAHALRFQLRDLQK